MKIRTLTLLALCVVLQACTSPERMQAHQEKLTDFQRKRQEARAIRIEEQDKRDRMRRNRMFGRDLDDPGLSNF